MVKAMNDMVDYYMKLCGEVDEDNKELIRETFWSGVRSILFKKIAVKGKDCSYQWAKITGKKLRYPNGRRIELSDKTKKYLWQMVERLNSIEGLDDLREIGILEAPEHIDDLINEIGHAKTDREIKREQFRLFLKNKHKIMKFLLG